MGQSSIIMVVTVAILFAIVSTNSNNRLNEVNDRTVNYYSENASQNLCNSATEIFLAMLADNNNLRVSNLTSLSLLDGNVKYTIKDTVIGGQNRIKIRIIANYNGVATQNIIITSIPEIGFIPPSIKAAVSTNNNIKTLGTLTIDGRDHKMDGSLVSGGGGTLGIWTTGTFNQSGNSSVGGSSAGSDYIPQRPGNANTIQTSQSYAGGYPDTPDKVMGGTANGFPEGYLKSVAISGSNGSQYVTNPSHLSYPLSGVTYVEMSGTWNSANINGSGILIIHNTSTNAIIKDPSGTFTGLIIADDVDKVHGTIIGGLVAMSPSPASGNCIGNGTGNIYYSSEAIKVASTKTGNSGSNPSYIGRYRLQVYSWLEL